MATTNTNPQHVDISLSQGIKITWADGHQSQYSLDHLRNNCPCATCRSAKHTQGHSDTPDPANQFPMFKPANRLTNAETVGRYAVRLLWADGHGTGIYSFDHLREICPCPQCRAHS